MKRTLLMALLFPLLFGGCLKDFTSLYGEGKKAFEIKDYVGAIDTLNEAIEAWKEKDGNDALAKTYQTLGMSYHKLYKLQNAIDAYHKAIERSNKTYEAAYHLGNIHLASNELKRATRAFQAALQMKQDDPMALLGLGNSHYLMGDYQLAKLNYHRILKTGPGVKEALEQLKLTNQKLRIQKKSKKRKRKRRK